MQKKMLCFLWKLGHLEILIDWPKMADIVSLLQDYSLVLNHQNIKKMIEKSQRKIQKICI